MIVESSISGNGIDFAAIDSGKIDLSRFEKVITITNGVLSDGVLSLFTDLGYSSDGRSTKDMIIDFQLDHGIIAKSTDPGAGNY